MNSANTIIGCIFGIPALLLAVYVLFTIRGKCPILESGWIFSSAEQKKQIDKRRYYRWHSIIVGGMALAFAFLSLWGFTEWLWCCNVAAGIILVSSLCCFVLSFVEHVKRKRRKR